MTKFSLFFILFLVVGILGLFHAFHSSNRNRYMSMSAQTKKTVSILGASGYTGAELVRLLSYHPHVEIKILTGDRSSGQEFNNIYPQYSYRSDLPKLTNWESSQSDIEKTDVVFCCLPHGTTQNIISILAKTPTLKIVDLSADFRLRDIKTYEQWYGKPHGAPELQKEAVYCIPEINRAEIRNTRILANPGCYPTAAQLPLVPLLKAGLIESDDIIIDAKSGTTGAGRSAKESSLYCEVTDGIAAYGVASHRHAPEIEQGLSDASGKSVIVNFTPHLMPMSRGIEESIYVKLKPGVKAADLKKKLIEQYEKEPFVQILPGSAIPQTRHVRGSNLCFMNVYDDRVPGRAIILSVIDNLVKGASGQAIQNMNIMFRMARIDEFTGYRRLFECSTTVFLFAIVTFPSIAAIEIENIDLLDVFRFTATNGTIFQGINDTAVPTVYPTLSPNFLPTIKPTGSNSTGGSDDSTNSTDEASVVAYAIFTGLAGAFFIAAFIFILTQIFSGKRAEIRYVEPAMLRKV